MDRDQVIVAGAALNAADLRSIERELHLRYNKWDTQVGDQRVLSAQPLLMKQSEWAFVCSKSEELAADVIERERSVLERDSWREVLGVPRTVWRILQELKRKELPRVPRMMRFDFHPTREGWKVSEVNSDVPGGWGEASTLPRLYQAFCSGFVAPPSPLEAWGEAVSGSLPTGTVVLLSAPGFLEDLQVVLTFAAELTRRGVTCRLAQSPEAFEWTKRGDCVFGATGEGVAGIVRFYQVEWLCRLRRRTRWRDLLAASQVPVINPLVAALSESKRFGMAFTGPSAWNHFVPECRDPREVTNWDEWVLKRTYSNTGDAVHLCGDLTRERREAMITRARRGGSEWVAQRRFETLALECEDGFVYPCVGVFVVDGRAAGAYVRLARKQVTDGGALEAPLFLVSETTTN